MACVCIIWLTVKRVCEIETNEGRGFQGGGGGAPTYMSQSSSGYLGVRVVLSCWIRDENEASQTC